jgi:glutathione S-transferase
MAKAKTKDETALYLNRIIQAPREKVFQAWIDPQALTKWFAPSEHMTTTVHALDLRVGGRYRFEMRDPDGKSHIVIGEYREIDAPTRLVFTWAWESEQAEDTQETLVTLQFRDQGKATEMLLTHERFPSERSRELHNQGWTGCLARLEQLLAAG